MDNKENKNFYKIPKLQKYLPKLKDKQKELTGIGITEHTLLTGKTGSGKSNSMLNFIEKSSGTYKKIYLIYKTYEPLYRFLEDSINGKNAEEHEKKLILIEGLNNKDMPKISDFKDLDEKNDKLYLFIFDDCVNDNSKADLNKILPFFTYGRKKGIHLFFLTQSYFDTNKFIRKNISHLILNGINGKTELRNILREKAIGDLDLDTLENMYKYCKTKNTDDEINFMKICCIECPTDKMISRNWDEYLDPKVFKVEKKDKSKKSKKSKKYDSDSDSDSSSSNDSSSDDDSVKTFKLH